jgi:hypothetical protein
MTKFENSWGIHMREGLAGNSLSVYCCVCAAACEVTDWWNEGNIYDWMV